MDVDLINSLKYSRLYGPISLATNNTASTGFDTRGYDGMLAVIVEQGILSAGDAGSQFTINLQTSATNAASNAANCAGAFGSLVFTGTTNNTATVAVLTYDVRKESRYMFVRTSITGGNSPAAPLAVTVVGKLQMQPN